MTVEQVLLTAVGILTFGWLFTWLVFRSSGVSTPSTPSTPTHVTVTPQSEALSVEQDPAAVWTPWPEPEPEPTPDAVLPPAPKVPRPPRRPKAAKPAAKAPKAAPKTQKRNRKDALNG
jgi:hypothetical protein